MDRNPQPAYARGGSQPVHAALLDRNRPLWEIYVIEGLPGGRFATYSKMHHALIDGVSGAKMMAKALAPAARLQKPPLWAQVLGKQPRPAESTATASLFNALADAARIGGEILPGIKSGLLDLLRRGTGDSAAARPFQAPPTPFNVSISGSRRFAAQSFSLARLKAIGKAGNATVNDVTLAICAGALRRHLLAHAALPKAPLIAMVPVSLHGEAGNGVEEGGNQVGILLANLATDVADPVARLQKIVQSTSAAKQKLKRMSRLEKVAHAAALMAPAAPSVLSGDARKRPLFNVVISNVPGPQDLLYLNGARLDEVYPVSIPAHFLALNITISGYGDKLGFGYIACRRSVPAMQRLLDYTEQSIAELEASLCPPDARAATARKTPVQKSPARTSKAAPTVSPHAAKLRKTPA